MTTAPLLSSALSLCSLRLCVSPLFPFPLQLKCP